MIGDIVDQHSLSTFVKGSKASSATDELAEAQKAVQALGRLFPFMRVCYGNHCKRYLKRADEVGLPNGYLKPFGEIIGAPRTWEFADEFIIDDVLYFHGDGYTGTNCVSQAIKNKFSNVVFGHTHQSSIQYINSGREIYWGMNVGALIDPEAYAFNYAKFFKNKPILGAGLVIDKVPHFVPMETN